MLHSAGIFAEIACPFFRRGLCDRPHCVYKHANEDQDMFGNLHESSVTQVAAGHHPTPINGATVNTESQVKCILELERINKEIETVKNEVEKEQRRLSRYQTVQVDSRSTGCKNSALVPKSKTKDVNGNSHRLPSCKHSTKPYSSAKKYVVDNSRPRTDLEYDPLSNFSADLRPSSSTDKEPRVRSSAKRARDSDQNKSPFTQLVESYEEEEEEEGVLIIDVPLSPDTNRSRHPKLCRSSSATQDNSEEVKKVKPAPTVANLPFTISRSLDVKSSGVVHVEVSKVNNECTTDNCNSLKVYLEPENDNDPKDLSVFDDLSKCLEDLKSESQKLACYQDPELTIQNISDTMPDFPKESASLHTNHLIDPLVMGNVHLLATEFSAESDPSNITFKINPAQPNKVSCENHTDYSLCSSYSIYQPSRQTRRVEEPAQSVVQSYWSPMQSVPLVSCFQKLPCQTQELSYSTSNPALPTNYLEQAAATAGIQLCQPPQVSSTFGQSSMTNGSLLPSTPIQQPVLETESGDIETISSGADEELNYSDVDLSDSDPMEECYRIFMEAEKEEEAESTKKPFVPLATNSTEKSEAVLKRDALTGQRKRMAHVSRNVETVGRSRLQSHTIVPLRGPAGPASVHQVVNASRIQQLQHKACKLTAALKGGQAFVSSATQRKVVTLAPPLAQTPPPMTASSTVTQPLQNVNYLPVGTAIHVGNNLHFILPEGSYTLPISSIASPVTSVISPISPVHTSQVAPMHTNHSIQATPINLYHPSPGTPVHLYHATQVTPIHSCHSTATTHLPVKAQTTSPPVLYTTAVTTAPQAAAYVAAKPISTKRKVKQRTEVNAKVPHDVRQRYVNMFVEEFLKTSTTVQSAFEKALTEEKTVYERSVNKLKYMSVAVNALKKLKNRSTLNAKAENESSVQQLKGSIPLNVKALKGNDDTALYESLKEHILTEEMLAENNYPLQHPENPGCAILFADTKKSINDALKRICCRCGATYSVGQTGKHLRKEECTYHYGKGVENKVPGGVETRYSCCEGVVGAPGCQVFKLHVHDAFSLDGFVRSLPRTYLDIDCPGVYSVDCEMCYTTHGLELSRVTVVNSSVQVVYDAFVRPDHEVIDYNTRFSSVSEKDVKGTSSSIRDVQETLLKFIRADTILIGHKLETDLCALKLLHATVVDTSLVFPHRLGPPHKLTLHKLTADNLRKIIQESVCGHDTAADAAACMELMLGKVKEDGKVRRW